MNTKKILFINNGLSVGGIERASVSLANHFAKLNYNVNIVALYKSEHFFKLHDRIGFLEPEFSRESLGRSMYIFKMMHLIRKSVLKIKPDVILAFGEWTNPYVVLATLGLGVPLYLSDRMSPIGKLPLVSLILKKVFYKNASGIIAQTGFAKKIIFENTKATNIKVIHNPVNCIERKNCELKKKIISVGRLTSEKGHRYLIEAFALLKDKTYELSIVGDGFERESLELLAKRLGIFNRIIFYGHLKDFTLQLSESQIFVLPSIKEGFPNALLEAMSLPLPCICSNYIGSPTEIIKNGINGILVEPANAIDLASAITYLIENPELRKKMAAEAYKVREILAFDKIAQKYLDFILPVK